MHRRTFAGGLISLIATGGAIVAHPDPIRGWVKQIGPLTETPDPDLPDDAEPAFLSLLNEERRSRGLGTVSRSAELSEMATAHAEDMATHDYIGHENADGDSIEDRYRARGLLPECRLPTEHGQYYPGAENAWGATDRVSGRRLADQAFGSWMQSRGHREAMLVASADEAGLGVAHEYGGEWTTCVALELC